MLPQKEPVSESATGSVPDSGRLADAALTHIDSLYGAAACVLVGREDPALMDKLVAYMRGFER